MNASHRLGLLVAVVLVACSAVLIRTTSFAATATTVLLPLVAAPYPCGRQAMPALPAVQSSARLAVTLGDTLASVPQRLVLMDGAANELTTLLTDTVMVHPSWAPDGTRIVLAVGDGSTSRIAILRLSDLRLTTLVTLPNANAVLLASPAWSPDGQQIAYVVGGNLFVQRIDAAKGRQLTQHGGISDPSWSPDGNRIAYTMGTALMAISVAGTDERTLVQRQGSLYTPAWSPDGERIAFVAPCETPTLSTENTIFVASLSDGAVQPLPIVIGPRSVGGVTWSPDGLRIAYVVSNYRVANLAMQNTDGSGSYVLRAQSPQLVTGIAWSPTNK